MLSVSIGLETCYYSVFNNLAFYILNDILLAVVARVVAVRYGEPYSVGILEEERAVVGAFAVRQRREGHGAILEVVAGIVAYAHLAAVGLPCVAAIMISSSYKPNVTIDFTTIIFLTLPSLIRTRLTPFCNFVTACPLRL